MGLLNKIVLELYHFLRVVIFTILCLPRDIQGAAILRKIKRKLKYVDRQNPSVSDYFLQWVSKTPNKPLIVYNDVVWTFKEVIETIS